MTAEDDRVLDHRAVGSLWDENAEAWTTLTRLGYDKYRDHINTPGLHGYASRCDRTAGPRRGLR